MVFTKNLSNIVELFEIIVYHLFSKISEVAMMEYFNTQLTVDIHDVDFNGVARTSALMKYIQSAAQTQLTENGMSYDQLKNKKRAFIWQ